MVQTLVLRVRATGLQDVQSSGAYEEQESQRFAQLTHSKEDGGLNVPGEQPTLQLLSIYLNLPGWHVKQLVRVGPIHVAHVASHG